MSGHLSTRVPSRRAAWLVAFAAVPAALLVSGLAVAGGSYAAFSAKATNPTDNWTAGTVVLSDDDSNGAMFSATNLKPGSTGEKCIAVTSTGSLPSVVKLYATGAATGTLAPYITLTVQVGTGGGFTAGCGSFTSQSQVYTGLLSTLASTYTSFASGINTWSPTGVGSSGETKVYRFSFTVDSAAPNTMQGATTSVGFTWEAQNS